MATVVAIVDRGQLGSQRCADRPARRDGDHGCDRNGRPAIGGSAPDRGALEAYTEIDLTNWIQPEDSSDVRITRRHIYGTPIVEIICDAKRNAIELLVMRTHGCSAILHLLMGSVAENVICQSTCPDLIVRPSQHRFVMP